MNIFNSINSNIEQIDSFSNFNEDQVQTTFCYTINIIEKETSCLWDQMYCSYLPPGISKGKLCEIPIFFKKHSKKFLMDSQKFFFNYKNIPFCNFILGLYQEYFIDYGKVTQDTLEIYKRGARKNDPFCMFKIAEILIRENEYINMRISLTFLLKSFLITSIESYKFIPENLLINFHNDYHNLDSFWYLSYYFETQNNLFLEILKEILVEENCSNEFYECLKYIFKNLYKIEELVNILKMLEDCYKKDNNILTAYHFCMFSFFISRIANLPINLEYISLILKNVADQGNYFACEKYAFYLDSKKDYRTAFNYFLKAQENFLPFSIFYLGNYFCSIKNPFNCMDIKKATDFYKKASYLGFSNLMEYMKILEINKEYDELFDFANFSYSCGIFGSELVLGECYEKGKGIEKNLYIAMSLYKRGLRKHKGGSGFLYRLSRILEKTKNELYKEFYKISFSLYLQFFEKDRRSEDNIWILDAYRIASMIGSGRGIEKEMPKANYFIDLILKANVNTETSSYTCLYHYLLRSKQNNLVQINSNNHDQFLTSVFSNETINSIQSYSDKNINNDIRISYLSKINDEKKTKINFDNSGIKSKNVFPNSNTESDFNLGGGVNESSDKSIKIEILGNSNIKKTNVNEYIKIELNENREELKEVEKEIEMVISETDRINYKNKNLNIENIKEESKYENNECNNIKEKGIFPKMENNYNNIQKINNINNNSKIDIKITKNENKNISNFLGLEKYHSNTKLKPNENCKNTKSINNILNKKLPNNNINTEKKKKEEKIDNFVDQNEKNSNRKPSILQMSFSNDDINCNLKSSNLSITMLTDSDNSCLGIEDFFLSNLKLLSKKRQKTNKYTHDNLNEKNNLKYIKNKDEILLENIEVSTEELVKIKKIFKKLKSNGIIFIELNDIIFDELLANGGYSKVYSGWYKDNKVAIKEFKNINTENISKIFQEIELQTNLKNNRINRILYVGLDTSPIKVCCVNKFMPYNLRSIILNIKLDIRQKLYISQQIFEAISYLHLQTPPIVHRDLKPENILIDNDLNIELCDFGIYKIISNEKSKTNTENRIYTVRYAPPEVINSMNFICKGSDIWSLGLILFDLFYEMQPWPGLSSDDIVNCVKKQRPFLVKNNKNVPTTMSLMIKKCTNYDYDQRPKITELQEYLNDLIRELHLNNI